MPMNVPDTTNADGMMLSMIKNFNKQKIQGQKSKEIIDSEIGSYPDYNEYLEIVGKKPPRKMHLSSGFRHTILTN